MLGGKLADIVLTSMSDGLITLDQQGVIISLNPAAADILGLKADEVQGRPYAEVFFGQEENDALNQMLLDLIMEGEERQYAEVPFRRDDGQIKNLAVTTSLLSDPDSHDTMGAALVFKDITAVAELRAQRDRLAKELESKHEELKRSYLDLESKNKNLGEAQRRVLWIKIGAGALAVALFVGLFLWHFLGSGGSVGSASGGDAPAAATVDGQELTPVKAHKGDVTVSVTGGGYIEPLNVISLTSGVAGRVIKRPVRLGDRVDKDELVLEIDRLEVLPKVRQAEAALLKAQNEMNQLTTWRKRPEFKQAERSLAMSKMNLAEQKRRFEQAEKLFKAGIISRNEYDEADTSLRRAQFDLAEATERLSQVKERGSPDNVKIAKLELDNAKAALEEAKDKLKATKMHAPIDGVVMQPPANKGGKDNKNLPGLGDQVSEGEAVMALGGVHELGVSLKVDEVDIRNISKGQAVRVQVQALSDSLTGKVRSVAPQAEVDKGSPTFAVMVALDKISDKKAANIRLGMSASVSIVVKQAKDALLVPVVAVQNRAKGPAVRVKKDGNLVWQPVEPGISDQQYVEIKKGLTEGQTVYY